MTNIIFSLFRQTLAPALAAILILSVTASCIEDEVDSSPSSQPEFSARLIEMGEFFTGERTPRSCLMVYNRHDKVMRLSNVSLRDAGSGVFRMNVDGMAGDTFSDVEIRPQDSIYVYIDALLPENGSPQPGEVRGYIDFLTNGVANTVEIKATGQDVRRVHATEITADERWDAEMPYQIYDSIVVRPGATLTLPRGAKLHFHDKAYMRVYGSLVTEGEPDALVELSGDRRGNVVGDIPFDLMASQWTGLHFAPGSTGNRLSHTVVCNTSAGVLADEGTEVVMVNCRLRNSAGYALESRHATLTLAGCEVADASLGAFRMTGGEVTANHCTFANYYLFTAPMGAIVQIDHFDASSDDGSGRPYLKADITNSILYGNGTDFSAGDLDGTEVTLRRCVLKSNGSDDRNFVECLWGTDPMFATVREDYYFDYRLKGESPALTHADAALTSPLTARDLYGEPRLPSPRPGAYQSGL